ncbi:hypothetical protein HPB52_013176 [Rhipicephalus sanguineus]|uniref:Uncharacterized protein n=1 Tax=Rhipicephalus sanguineus TaxID=34632 RepID=A0A9D4T3Q2_RHISA|nr:hypothetical protein HPB52_013176 [Rhipicephalus sanguineus]
MASCPVESPLSSYVLRVKRMEPNLPDPAALERELTSLRTAFSRTRFQLPLQCTETPTRACCLFERLDALNEMLWFIGFEVSEVSPGRIAIGHLEDATVTGKNCDKDPIEYGAIVLHCLLAKHRCVRAVERRPFSRADARKRVRQLVKPLKRQRKITGSAMGALALSGLTLPPRALQTTVRNSVFGILKGRSNRAPSGPPPNENRHLQAQRHAKKLTRLMFRRRSSGVIRGIPLEDIPRDITTQVITPENPTAIAAKRLSNTTNVIVLFSGLKVPTFVRYGGALIKCALYRKQLELCHQCVRLGHRMDVCPSPQDRVCRGCGTANPGTDHQCNPCCQLCGGKQLDALLGRPDPVRALGPVQEPDSPDHGAAHPLRPDPDPGAIRPRGSGLAAATYKVGWVDVVKGSLRRGGSGETAAFREMAEMRRENAQLRDLIANLTREIQELKNNQKADISPRPSSSHGGAAAETPYNRMEEDENPPPPKRKAPAVISQTGSQLTDLGQKLTEMQSALKDQAEAVGNLTLPISTVMSRLDKFENNVATLSLRVAKLHQVTTAGAPATGVASNQFQNAATSTAAVSGVVQSTTPQSSTSRTEQNRQTR